MGYSLCTNRKSISSTESPQRNEQFEYIARLRQQYASKGQPIISVDTKKKELVGQFKNAGRNWEPEPVEVNDHDFRSQAIGMAVPYGIYELLLNRGTVYVGTNKDTAELATDAIAQWWRAAGKDYSNKHRLLILADGGGSNSARGRAWKAFVQTQLAERFGLEVTVCHCLSLPAWNLEVESDRTPVVQRDQQELERKTPGQLRHDTQLHPYHEDIERTKSTGKTAKKSVQKWNQGIQGGLRWTIPRAP